MCQEKWRQPERSTHMWTDDQVFPGRCALNEHVDEFKFRQDSLHYTAFIDAQKEELEEHGPEESLYGSVPG